MPNRHLEKIMQARRERFARSLERRKIAELALLRAAANGLVRWQGECRRRACRRARCCAGRPVKGPESFPPLMPPCITRDSFEPVRQWVRAHCGRARTSQNGGRQPPG